MPDGEKRRQLWWAMLGSIRLQNQTMVESRGEAAQSIARKSVSIKIPQKAKWQACGLTRS